MIFHFFGEKSKMTPKRTRHNSIDEALSRDSSLASTQGKEGGHVENVVGALSLPMFFLNYLKKDKIFAYVASERFI